MSLVKYTGLKAFVGRRSRRFRGLCLLAAAALLLAPVKNLAHLLSVEHGVCLEHGEIIDLEKHHGSAHEHGREHDDRQPSESLIDREPLPLHGNGSDHCLATLCFRQESRMGPMAPDGRPEAGGDFQLGRPPEAGLPFVIAVYFIAPKHSPPA